MMKHKLSDLKYLTVWWHQGTDYPLWQRVKRIARMSLCVVSPRYSRWVVGRFVKRMNLTLGVYASSSSQVRLVPKWQRAATQRTKRVTMDE